MPGSTRLDSIRQHRLAAIAFSLPLWPQLTIALTAFALLLALPGFFHAKRSKSAINLLTWNILLFVALLIGLLWTKNLNSGIKECKDELYLLLFPILFLSTEYSRPALETARKGLIYGCIAATVICLSWASILFFKTGDGHLFYYTSYSRLLHPTNFGLLLSVSVMFIIDDLRKIAISERNARQYITLALLLVSLTLLASKVNYIGIFMLSAIGILFSIARKNYGVLKDKRLLFVAGMVAVFAVMANFYYNRSNQVVAALEQRPAAVNDNGEVDSSIYNSTTIRIAQWKYSYELGQRQPVYGNGTGDEVDELLRIFSEHRDPYALLHFRHAHSYYLHYGLMLGIPGLLLAVLALLVPAIAGIKRNDFLLTGFYCLMLLIGLTDIITHATLGAAFTFIGGMLIAGSNARLDAA